MNLPAHWKCNWPLLSNTDQKSATNPSLLGVSVPRQPRFPLGPTLVTALFGVIVGVPWHVSSEGSDKWEKSEFEDVNTCHCPLYNTLGFIATVWTEDQGTNSLVQWNLHSQVPGKRLKSTLGLSPVWTILCRRAGVSAFPEYLLLCYSILKQCVLIVSCATK